MKSLLALLVIVGVAWCNSTGYYGWTPNKEFVYRYESQVLTGIPDIRESQYAGIRLSSEVRVQTFSDYSLRIKFEKTRFLTVNGEVNLSQRGRLNKGSETEQGVQESEVPSHLKSYLEKPFLVHMKRGVVENFFVEESEPSTITNIKRSFLSQIQLDITGSRRSEIESNHIEQQNGVEDSNVETPLESNKDITYFTTREESLHGDCQTSYTVHELPKYRSLELEQEWKEEENMLYKENEIKSKGEEVCQGKQYFRITKTKNLDNCHKRPFFQKFVGIQSRCDASKAGCADLFTHLVSTTCVVCGELNEFVIRKCLKKDIVSQNPMGWNTEENMKTSSTVSVELLKEESSFSPIPAPSDLKEKKSLFFEFPESNSNLLQGKVNKHTDQSGIQAVLEQPDLLSAPKMLFTSEVSKSEVSRQIVDELRRIATEIFESPESCSSTGDVAGHLAAISKYLLPLSFDELKAVRDEVLRENGSSEESKKVLKSLFYDVLSLVGSNPSTMLIKKEVESGELTGRLAINVLESALRSIKTPTKELLKELVQLTKGLKTMQWNEHTKLGSNIRDLYSITMIQMSKLFYRACIHPVRRMTEFPVRIYGHFCSNESSIITEEWIPYLESELESTESRNQDDEHYRLLAIASLGKLGHIKGLHPLIKVIDGSISKKPMVRSVAVYSLKRIAKLNPVLIKPILLSIIDNPAENTQVRIAAVSVLPWSHPSMAQLQKMAVRTWFEPSKQVASFIYSTLRSLKTTEVPELKAVGLKASSIIHMVKPFHYGAQFSHNANFAEFVEYLKTSVSKKVAWVYNEEEIVPTKISMSNNFYNPAFVVRGLSYSIYTQGMDQLLDKVLYYTSKKTPAVSESINKQLEKISEELKIKKQEDKKAEVLVQSRMVGYERLYTINKDYIMEILEQATESLQRNPQIFSEGRHFEYTHAIQAFDIQSVGPSSAGFLLTKENIMPVVYSIKGFFKGENPIDAPLPIPTKMTAKLMPIVNAKVHSHAGVICPFTHKLIGAGVDAAVHLSTPLEAEIEVDNMDQVSVSIRTPESIKKSVELLHAYITPYTVRKDLKTVKPISKASDVKEIISRNPLKKIDLDLGKKLGLASKLIAETDAKFVDLYSYWEKVKQHSLVSVFSLGVLPSSIRKTSTKIVYDPIESETKEFSLRFSLTSGKRNHENKDEDHSHSDEKMIKKICKSNYHSHEAERCVEHLNNLEIISREAEELCQQHNFDDELDRKQCHKTAQICEKALKICESRNGVRSKHCEKQREACKARVNSTHSMKKMLQKMGKNSQLNRLNVQAAIQGRFNKRSVQTTLSFGSSAEEQGRIVKYFAGAEIEIPEKSAQYEVACETQVVYPMINHRWNTKQLLEEEIKMEVERKIRYGRKENQREVSFKSILEKSEEQKQAVRSSPEYIKCIEQEQQNMVLSPMCMKARHQAASVDKVNLNIELAQELHQLPAVLRVEEYLKAYFVSQVSVNSESSVNSPKEIKLVLNLSRAGDEAQLKVERVGHQWVVKNIRLPVCFNGILPMSLRNRIVYRLFQKLTHNQAPASCRIESDYVGTFDNKTFHYEMNDCQHLLFKDCSGKVPVAVLARSESGPRSAKEVEILAGVSQVVLKPKSSSQASGMTIDLKIKDVKKSIELTNGQVHVEKCPESEEVLVEMKRYSDNVYNIWFHKEMLQVITDGLRIEIVAPQLVHGRTCGLCGDFNGENTADLKTPRQCLMRKNRFFAYSYMLNKEGSSSEGHQCTGIPHEDREEYNRESQQCIKKEEILTPLKNVYHRLFTLANPTVSVHLVKKQANQLCVSRQKVKLCSPRTQEEPIAKTYLQGNIPAEVKPRNVEFSCVPLPSQKAFSLERRAKRGDNLQAELQRLPVHFSHTEYEPVLCNVENQQQKQKQQQHQQQQQNDRDYFQDY